MYSLLLYDLLRYGTASTLRFPSLYILDMMKLVKEDDFKRLVIKGNNLYQLTHLMPLVWLYHEEERQEKFDLLLTEINDDDLKEAMRVYMALLEQAMEKGHIEWKTVINAHLEEMYKNIFWLVFYEVNSATSFEELLHLLFDDKELKLIHLLSLGIGEIIYGIPDDLLEVCILALDYYSPGFHEKLMEKMRKDHLFFKLRLLEN